MIRSLTSLRGIFIILIFLHHCLGLYPGGGSLSVAFFFVLGGFCMMSGYKESVLSSSFDYKKYLVRRCGKFYPLHWLCLLVSVPLVVRPSGGIKQIGLFVLNAALLQSWVPVREVYFCFNAVSWYLADTMFFTILFPFVFRCIASATLRGRTLIAGAIALVYLVSLVFIPDEKYHAILYISPYIRLTDFLFGIYLAIAYEGLKTINCLKVRRLPSLFRDFIIVAIVAVLIIESCILPEKIQLMAPVYWPFIACLVLYASLSESSEEDSGLLKNKYLVQLGELSFVIFMIHQLVLSYTDVLINNTIHYKNPVLYVGITFCLTIVASILVRHYFLKPVTQWLTRSPVA